LTKLSFQEGGAFLETVYKVLASTSCNVFSL